MATFDEVCTRYCNFEVNNLDGETEFRGKQYCNQYFFIYSRAKQKFMIINNIYCEFILQYKKFLANL